MQVSELTSVFNDDMQKIIICDLAKGENVYAGTIEQLPSVYDSQDVCSVDTITEDTLTINIESTES
jgi:hypothetical protein